MHTVMLLTQAAIVPLAGVLVQLGGSVLLVGFFILLRRYVFRRPYFSAWVGAWFSVTVAILALAVRFGLLNARPEIADDSVVVRLLYFVYQSAKIIGFIYFLRGTSMYVAGGRGAGAFERPALIVGALIVAAAAALFARSGFNEMV